MKNSEIGKISVPDKSGTVVGSPSPRPGVVVGKVVGVAYDVGVVIVCIADTCGTAGNDGKPGDGTDPPKVGTAAGTAPPGTDVVALGTDIPSDASTGMDGTEGTAAATGAGVATGTGWAWEGAGWDTSSTGIRWR